MICLYITRLRRSALALLMLMFFISKSMLAQSVVQESVRGGTVLDSYGNPIEGVTIQVKGDSVAGSDSEGNFVLLASVKNGDVLAFEHPDFYVQTLILGTETSVRIKDDSQTSERFNVTLFSRYLHSPEELYVLYGKADRRSQIGSISTIHTEQLNTTPAPTVAYALAGRLPGLYLSQSNGFRVPATGNNYTVDLGGNVPRYFLGAPSDNTEFGISLRGQAPVVVIDGVQRDIYSIDPDNIESVSVLKDAFSSLLLGMRSSRGVLLITTKRPDKQEFKLSFTGQVGVQSALNMPKPLPAFQYAYLLNEALQNDNKAAVYTNADFEAFKNGTDPIRRPNVDWYDQALRSSAPMSSYNLNISGGGRVARYSISGSYMNQQGLFITSSQNSYQTNAEQKRYTISSNVAVDVTDDFLVDVSLFARVQDGSQPGAGTGALLSQILETPNSAYPIYNPNGSYGGNVSYQTNLMARLINSGYIEDNSRDVLANIGLHYNLNDVVQGLTANAVTNISTQNITALTRSQQNTVFQYVPSESGEGGKYTQYGSAIAQSNNFAPVSTSRLWYAQLSLDYDRMFGKHHVVGKLFGDRRVVTINYDLPQTPSNLAARVQYDYEGKYFAEGAFTRSHVNVYAPGMQWGSFYAAGLGWDLSKEVFLQDVAWLDQFKLHGVYGKTGNGIDNSGYYIFRQTYSRTFTDGTYQQGFGRTNGTGLWENSPLANPNITWEKAHKLDVGVDVSVLDNHLQLTADYYYDRYYDLLQNRGKNIALIGFAYPQENIGENLYKGLELSATYQNNLGDFNYFLTGNWSRMATEVVFLDEQKRVYDYNRVTGESVGAYYGYIADGFFSSTADVASSAKLENITVQPGDIKYRDLNGDDVINQYDQTIIGRNKPLSYYGVTAGFNFKGFDVSVLLQGAYNRDQYIRDAVVDAGFQVTGQSYGQAYEQILGRWTPETAETATYPRLSTSNNFNNTQTSSFWVRSGDYMRLKNVSIGYTLPFRISNRYGISQLKFFVNGQNLFTAASYDAVDPEVTSFRNYPIMRVISGGINIKL
ncbi:SusC/RagA family TonB-linked outer membrane protein [Parachryseolinea silvisoli]|uniref:SusC/RagA family TonB-linked outer membrane protein n=1 Tax=Parachryseolinea silvisoli TaxID=2873601 RepID=UPI002265DFCB|nr:SusC/RagA family TonB-linked outer membrane protein [Parachryseolinea silvisoli]MCD9014828.1 SusC/RagA family TonB-linked outer membrane protein [Parachryseolinea silvisoli]